MKMTGNVLEDLKKIVVFGDDIAGKVSGAMINLENQNIWITNYQHTVLAKYTTKNSLVNEIIAMRTKDVPQGIVSIDFRDLGKQIKLLYENQKNIVQEMTVPKQESFLTEAKKVWGEYLHNEIVCPITIKKSVLESVDGSVSAVTNIIVKEDKWGFTQLDVSQSKLYETYFKLASKDIGEFFMGEGNAKRSEGKVSVSTKELRALLLLSPEIITIEIKNSQPISFSIPMSAGTIEGLIAPLEFIFEEIPEVKKIIVEEPKPKEVEISKPKEENKTVISF